MEMQTKGITITVKPDNVQLLGDGEVGLSKVFVFRWVLKFDAQEG